MIGGIAWPDRRHRDRAGHRGVQRLCARLRRGARRRRRGDRGHWSRRGTTTAHSTSRSSVYPRSVPGSAHVVGMFATGLLTYIVVLVVARLLGADREAAGARASECARRRDRRVRQGRDPLMARALHRALLPALAATSARVCAIRVLAPYLVTYDAPVETRMLSTIPWFARPFVDAVLQATPLITRSEAIRLRTPVRFDSLQSQRSSIARALEKVGSLRRPSYRSARSCPQVRLTAG